MTRALLICMTAMMSIAAAFAQTYPVKPIHFIVPYPPGGGTDLLGRTLGLKLAAAMGQQVIVENRAGAQGNIGTVAGAKAAPDGYTIVLSYVGTFAMNPWLYKNVGFDPIKDFAQVSLASVQPYVVVVNPVVPVKNLKELGVLSRSSPERLSFGSSASAGQLAGEFFNVLTKSKMLHIPYKGAGPAMIDLLGGHIDLMFASPASSVPQVKSGKLRALAVTAPTRLTALPDVPTSRESGFGEFEINGWYGVAAPANTPRDIVVKLNTEIARALRTNDVQERLMNDGLEGKSNSADEMTAFVKSELDRWGQVIKAAGIRPE